MAEKGSGQQGKGSQGGQSRSGSKGGSPKQGPGITRKSTEKEDEKGRPSSERGGSNK